MPAKIRSIGVRARTLPVDLWACAALGLGALFWASAAKPLSDPDIWWHVRTGQLILDSGVPTTEPWAYTALGRTWVPTAWLSDVALAALQDAFGWTGIIVFKLILSAVLLIYLGKVMFARAIGPAAAFIFTLAVLAVSPFLSERPQLISLALTVWLSGQALTSLDGGKLSWSVLPVTYLWANLHGMWVLVPLTMCVLIVGLVIDRPQDWRSRVNRLAALGIASVLLAMLTPVGPRLAIWSIVIRDAARDISEWQPTVLADPYGMAYLLIFLAWVVAISGMPRRASLAEVTWMIAVFTLGVQAGRNVAPTAILMAPVAARALTRAFPVGLGRLPRYSVPAAVPLTLVAAAGILASVVHVQRGTVVDGLPYEIVKELHSRPGGSVKVLNDYNVGGFLTGEGAPKISVAIDGRTDNYDPDFVNRYLRATSHLIGWRGMVRSLSPDVAVTVADSPLSIELQDENWTVVMIDGPFVLLDRPDDV